MQPAALTVRQALGSGCRVPDLGLTCYDDEEEGEVRVHDTYDLFREWLLKEK